MDTNDINSKKTQEPCQGNSATLCEESRPSFPIGKDILGFFNKLDWNIVDNTEYTSCTNNFLPSHPTPCLVKGLMDGNLYPYPVNSDYHKMEEIDESVDVSKPYVPGVEYSTIIYPESSALSKKDQGLLYLFLCRKHFQNIPLSEDECIEYENLLQQVAAEHVEFQMFVKWEWMREHYKRSLKIEDSVQEYIDKLWKFKLEQCLAIYPHAYKEGTAIPLALNDPNNDHTIIDFKQKLRTKGSAQHIYMPGLKKRYDLITDLSQLCLLKPVSLQPPLEPLSHPTISASLDPEVRLCIEKNNIDVVVTCSAIKAIVDMYNYHVAEWALPVTVQNVSSNEEQTKKVVILDKRLPVVAMSVHHKNVWHAKIASKWAMKLTNKFLYKTMKTQGVGKQSTEYSDMDKSPMEVEEFEEARGFLRCDQNTSGNDDKQEGCKQKTRWTQKNDLPGPLLDYSLWELHKSTHYAMAKSEQRSLKVLIRSKVDGCLKYTMHNKSQQDNVYITSKLEFQPEYGASKMSKSELLREFVDIYIRKSKLCRVRAVGNTKEVMLLEVKALQEVKDQLLRTHNLQTETVFDPLYAVLTKLVDIPAGHYLLRHTPKMGHFAQLMPVSTSGAGFNLAVDHVKPLLVDVNLPAAEIDPFLLTAVHFRDKHPPALFDPTVDNSQARYLKTPQPKVPTKGKKNKSKKKN